MKPVTQKYLHEAGETLQKTRQEFLETNSMNASLCERAFASGVELTVKAYEFEATGQISHTHAISTISQSCSLWNLLPSSLQAAINEWAPFDPNVRYPDTQQYYTLVNSIGPDQADRMTTKALELHSFVSKLVT